VAVHWSREVYRQVVRWLRTLPEGATITWSSAALTPKRPFACLWAGIYVPDCPASSRFGWIWSVARAIPRDRRDDPLWIHAESDLEIFSYGVPGTAPVLVEWSVPAGSDWRPPAITAPLPEGGRWLRSGGWSPDAISATLAAWAVEHAGRADLVVQWDPVASQAKVVDLNHLRIDLDVPGGDGDDLYQLGPGSYITGSVLDSLLALDPWEAAQVSGRLAGRTLP
jgi:hypothetical protein